jgi:hypothetical protein
MKKINILFLTAIAGFILTACGSKPGNDESLNDSLVQVVPDSSDIYLAEGKKYGIKSAIVNFESSGADYLKGSKDILYFDEFGVKEVIEGYKDGKLIDKVICNGDGYLYEVKYDEKICNKIKNELGPGVAERFSLSPTEWSDYKKEQYNFKMLDDMVIAGKTCKSYSTFFMDINKRYAGWKSIVLFRQVSFVGMEGDSINEIKSAVRFEEAVEIPQSAWEIPKGFKIVEK